jgi:hypothetical protein
MSIKTEFYFEGATVQQVLTDLLEYGSEGTRIKILKDGAEHYIQVVSSTGEGGDPLNDSHVCPGSPGC